MVIYPFRCVDRHLHFGIDIIAVVYSFKKRRSKDMMANSVIRSAYPNADCRWPDPLRPSSALELDQYAATGTYPTFPPPPSDWIVDKAPSV